MLVRQMDNAGRFSVTSADDRDYYVVDITENEGRMVCSCADFRFRCQRQLDTGSKAYPYSSSSLRTGCKHTHAVVLFLGQTYIAAISGKNRTEAQYARRPEQSLFRSKKATNNAMEWDAG
jgi:hypothetical protein